MDNEEKLSFIDIVNRLHNDVLSVSDYEFYMIIDGIEYEIIPIYTTDCRLVEIELEEDCDNIFEEFNLIDIVNAKYFIKRCKDVKD